LYTKRLPTPKTLEKSCSGTNFKLNCHPIKHSYPRKSFTNETTTHLLNNPKANSTKKHSRLLTHMTRTRDGFQSQRSLPTPRIRTRSARYTHQIYRHAKSSDELHAAPPRHRRSRANPTLPATTAYQALAGKEQPRARRAKPTHPR